jgi:Holliday junction resolvase RusA-like endonuclease
MLDYRLHCQFLIEGKLKPKQSFKMGKNGGYLTKAIKDYQALVSWKAKEAMQGKEKLTNAVKVKILINRSVPESWSKKKRKQALEGYVMPITRPDSDNSIKGIFDGLNDIVYNDDAQICSHSVDKQYSEKDSVHVAVYNMEFKDDKFVEGV